MGKKLLDLKNKFDRLTGELIEYKSIEQYQIQEFKNKINMKSWLKRAKEENKIDFAVKYIEETFAKFKELKNINFAPDHFQLKSIKYLPNIITINQYYDKGYISLMESLNLPHCLKYDFDHSIFNIKLPPDLTIIQDTREQKGLLLGKIKKEIKKLDFGDYSLDRENQLVYVERKSLSDAVSTLSGGYDRFIREIERAKNKNKKIIVLIETSYNNFYAFNYNKSVFSKATPEFIFHRVRELCKLYPETIQFLCVNGRKEAAKILPYLLYLDKDLIKYDLQYLYDTKQLNQIL